MGKLESLQEGREQGHEAGLEQGLEKGRKKNVLSNGKKYEIGADCR